MNKIEPTNRAYIYGAGTRLSSAYTQGYDGLPLAKHHGNGAAKTAWECGKRDAKRAALLSRHSKGEA